MSSKLVYLLGAILWPFLFLPACKTLDSSAVLGTLEILDHQEFEMHTRLTVEKKHLTRVADVAMAGQKVASIDINGVLKVWEALNGAPQLVWISDHTFRSSRCEGQQVRGVVMQGPARLRISTDGNFVVVAFSNSQGSSFLLDLRSGTTKELVGEAKDCGESSVRIPIAAIDAGFYGSSTVTRFLGVSAYNKQVHVFDLTKSGSDSFIVPTDSKTSEFELGSVQFFNGGAPVIGVTAGHRVEFYRFEDQKINCVSALSLKIDRLEQLAAGIRLGENAAVWSCDNRLGKEGGQALKQLTTLSLQRTGSTKQKYSSTPVSWWQPKFFSSSDEIAETQVESYRVVVGSKEGYVFVVDGINAARNNSMFGSPIFTGRPNQEGVPSEAMYAFAPFAKLAEVAYEQNFTGCNESYEPDPSKGKYDENQSQVDREVRRMDVKGRHAVISTADYTIRLLHFGRPDELAAAARANPRRNKIFTRNFVQGQTFGVMQEVRLGQQSERSLPSTGQLNHMPTMIPGGVQFLSAIGQLLIGGSDGHLYAWHGQRLLESFFVGQHHPLTNTRGGLANSKVQALAFSKDGKYLASADWYGRVIVWDLMAPVASRLGNPAPTTRRQVALYVSENEPMRPVSRIEFSNDDDSRHLLFVDGKGIVKWDWRQDKEFVFRGQPREDGATQHVLGEGFTVAAFSTYNDHIIAGRRDGKLDIYSSEDLAKLHEVSEGIQNPIVAIEAFPARAEHRLYSECRTCLSFKDAKGALLFGSYGRIDQTGAIDPSERGFMAPVAVSAEGMASLGREGEIAAAQGLSYMPSGFWVNTLAGLPGKNVVAPHVDSFATGIQRFDYVDRMRSFLQQFGREGNNHLLAVRSLNDLRVLTLSKFTPKVTSLDIWDFRQCRQIDSRRYQSQHVVDTGNIWGDFSSLATSADFNFAATGGSQGEVSVWWISDTYVLPIDEEASSN